LVEGITQFGSAYDFNLGKGYFVMMIILQFRPKIAKLYDLRLGKMYGSKVVLYTKGAYEGF
jgi:hypothetical protein